MRSYSNQSHQVEHLRKLLAIPPTRRPDQPARPAKQEQRRLRPEQIGELVATYEAGTGVKKLAAVFGIHRYTVNRILQREGVQLRQRGLGANEVDEVARLYRDGWSLARIGDKFGVHHSTVANALRRIDVALRPRRGWEPKSARGEA